jgi:hypothetical protein
MPKLDKAGISPSDAKFIIDGTNTVLQQYAERGQAESALVAIAIAACVLDKLGFDLKTINLNPMFNEFPGAQRFDALANEAEPQKAIWL